MSISSSSETCVFKPAVLPVFGIYFGVMLITGLLALYPETPFTLPRLALLISLAGLISGALSLFVWRVTAETLSREGMEIWSIRGRRLLPWKDIATVQTYSRMRLVYLRFSSEAVGSRRVLIFQRKPGEFGRAVAELAPVESLVWRHFNNAYGQ